MQRLNLARHGLLQLALNEASFISDIVGDCVISKMSCSDLRHEGNTLISPSLG